ncbi:MAG: hypothetical protein WED00_10545 [Aquisalimonadaceae bacterium]
MSTHDLDRFFRPDSVAVIGASDTPSSGKILRKSIRQLSVEADVPVPPTIDDPSSLEEIRSALEQARVGRYR